MSKNTEAKAPPFTPRDMELLAAVTMCLKSDLVVDYNKFAKRGGFKNANSARVAWFGLKKKVNEVNGVASEATEITDANGTKRKADSAAGDGEEEDGTTAKETPKTKRARGGGKGKGGKVKEEEQSSD